MRKRKSENKPKALVLFSGGLDSRLAIKILQKQCHVEALYFELPFGSGCCNFGCSFNFTQAQGVKLHCIDCTKGRNFTQFLDVIKNPKHGRGAGINPCIDCRIFLLKKAKHFAKKYKFDIIATGEVLGERPMSQHKQAMMLIERKAGLEGKILRPLSAKLLSETAYEKQGLIDRKKLLAIQGRCRKEQMKLAKKYKIKYPSPAGGCLLTHREFGTKFMDLVNHEKNPRVNDFRLLRFGRHFRVGLRNSKIRPQFSKPASQVPITSSRISYYKIIVGRNEEENKQLVRLKNKNDLMFEAEGVMGPTTILQSENNKKLEKSLRDFLIIKAAMLTARYGDAKTKKVCVAYGTKKFDKKILVDKMKDNEIEKIRI